MKITVVLRRRAPLPPPSATAAPPLSREEFAQTYGADPADIQKVEEFASANGLTVASTDVGRRTVVLSGTAGVMKKAFDVNLVMVQQADHTYRARSGMIYVPAALQPIVEAVLGLDNRPQARSRFRIIPRAQADVSYTPVQVAKFYNFPSKANGAGQTIGIIELGGGYNDSDLSSYFSGLGISPAPTVIAASVDGATNQPAGDPNSADGEVLLDIEIAGAVAPGAAIVVYFAPNTDQGFLDAITTAVHDAANKPSVISISWGSAEANWTQQSLHSFDQAFQDAGTLGVTICAAAGD
ncbi:MAG TPA: protease pro-enzyme activation domain-containing protein, partial [Bryobacteraceae bacterium]|nr:protease pro-enzyme activation domain-containing protein [Bryobacteraceae bacterium]